MKNVLNLIRILIAIDIGIVVFCYLEDNFKWLINTQFAFFSTTLIILGSFIGYSNMVKASLQNGNVGEDILKKYDDRFDLYDEEDKIEYKKENKKFKWYEAFFFSFKGGMNFIRILGYILLIGSFLYLNNKKIFDYLSFLFGVSIVPIVSLVYLYVAKNK